MKNFEVTGHGMQLDKVAIKPGSKLIIDSTPPAHWSRFGRVADRKVLTVATPPKKVRKRST